MAEIRVKVEDIGEVSDGYHTFNELYHHRMVLFSVICNQNKERAWKSKLHHDGTMYEDYFIVGVTTDEGDYTYHYHMDDWGYFNVKELDFAPEWDGHTGKDIARLSSLQGDDNMNTITLIEELRNSLPNRKMLEVVAVGAVEIDNRLIILKSRFPEMHIFSKDEFVRFDKDLGRQYDYEEIRGKLVIFDHSIISYRGREAIKKWLGE
jgi:hypothetical protein